MLGCSAHPSAEIATIPANFWFRLVKEWLRLPGPEHKARLRVTLQPFYAQLVPICVRLLRYPASSLVAPPDDAAAGGGGGGGEDDKDDLRAQRQEVSDTLTDCCQILGGAPCLAQAYAELQKELGAAQAAAAAAGAGPGGVPPAPEWQGVEACLHAVQAIAPQVPREEGEVMPAVFQLIIQLPAWPRVIATANLCIGRYAAWLHDHPDCIQPLFQFLLQHVGAKSLTASSSASRSIKRICEHCARHMGEPALSRSVDGYWSWLTEEILMRCTVTPTGEPVLSRYADCLTGSF